MDGGEGKAFDDRKGSEPICLIPLRMSSSQFCDCMLSMCVRVEKSVCV